ncbi:hypothetical protein WN51_12003 [Melipona quadrifasciata]|uniref:Uncharacterized protein n=1 Tax=Melipona quadrifasciata TaxID=166423 RepID=A0A0M9A3G5_9HYME|nr:hypothetical protein WN51_12003 [Melipona quadrifasciata]
MYEVIKAKVKNIEDYDILRLIAEPNLKLESSKTQRKCQFSQYKPAILRIL